MDKYIVTTFTLSAITDGSIVYSEIPFYIYKHLPSTQYIGGYDTLEELLIKTNKSELYYNVLLNFKKKLRNDKINNLI